MTDSIKEIADPFIDLANQRTATGMEPEQVGEGMLYGTARYMAFLVGRFEAAGMGSRQMNVERMTAEFRRMIEHHLVQLPHPCSHPDHHHGDLHDGVVHGHPPHTSLANDDDVAHGLGEIMRSFSTMDVVLVAYLRGMGHDEIADGVALDVTEARVNPTWDIAYAKRLLEAMSRGLIGESVALAAIVSMLTPRMLDESKHGYVKDPRLDAQAQRDMAQFFAGHQLHRLATMIRKDPARFSDLQEAGMTLLLGPKYVAFRKTFDAKRPRAH